MLDLEARQDRAVREKVDAILADVKTVTARVNEQTERVDHAITGTIDRVDETADARRDGVRDKISQRGRRASRGVRRRDRVDSAPAVAHGVLENGAAGRHEPDGTQAGGYMAYEYDRFEREEGGGSFLMGLLTGTVLGAGLGMLFAPKAGSELRNRSSANSADRPKLRSTAGRQAVPAGHRTRSARWSIAAATPTIVRVERQQHGGAEGTGPAARDGDDGYVQRRGLVRHRRRRSAPSAMTERTPARRRNVVMAAAASARVVMSCARRACGRLRVASSRGYARRAARRLDCATSCATPG